MSYRWPDPCPSCGEVMLDNREMKRSEKAPDYMCGNRDCKGGSGGKFRFGAWAQPKSNTPGMAPARRPASPPPAAPAGDVDLDALERDYRSAKDIALNAWEGLAVSLDAIAMTTSTHAVFIELCKRRAGGYR